MKKDFISQSILARPLILDQKKKILVYELLFRSSEIKKWDGEKTTAEIITNSIEFIGLDNITGNKPAFINFTAKLIKDGILDLLAFIEIFNRFDLEKLDYYLNRGRGIKCLIRIQN